MSYKTKWLTSAVMTIFVLAGGSAIAGPTVSVVNNSQDIIGFVFSAISSPEHPCTESAEVKGVYIGKSGSFTFPDSVSSSCLWALQVSACKKASCTNPEKSFFCSKNQLPSAFSQTITITGSEESRYTAKGDGTSFLCTDMPPR